jgi:hypothetical protein
VKYKIKSQLYSDAEAQQKGAKQILDDCTWSSCAAAVSWASGYTVDYSAADGVAAQKAALKRVDKQGVSDNGGSLPEAIKVIAHLGGKARYAKSWEDAVAAAKAGAALIVHVQQAPRFYPEGLKVSAWHDRWFKWWSKHAPEKIQAGYGHCTSAGYDDVDGWQWACPTRDEKVAAEKYGVPVTEAQLRQIANSKVKAGKYKADYKALLIVTHPGKKAITPAPVAAPIVAPAPVAAPVAVASLDEHIDSRLAAAPTIAVEAPKSHVERSSMPKGTKTAAVIADAEAALQRVDWDDKGKEAISALVEAAKASNGKKGFRAKASASIGWIIANTGIDEMVIEAARTGIGTGLAIALASGSQITKLDADQADMIFAGAIAACLQVIVRALNPDDPKFGVGKAKAQIANGNGPHKD